MKGFERGVTLAAAPGNPASAPVRLPVHVPVHVPVVGRPGPRVDMVRSIAVLRAGGLGDLLFALPALDALRAAYPEASIALLGRAWQGDLLRSRPSPVDDVVDLPPIPGVTAPPGSPVDPGTLDAICRDLAAMRFDIALQLHGGGRHSNPFVRRLGARVTAGLRAADAEPLDRNVRYVYYQSEVLRALEVAGLIGATPVRLEAALAVTEADRGEAAAALHDAGLSGTVQPDGRHRASLVVLHPGAGDPRRRWPAASFAAVGAALAGRGAAIAITGSGDEASLVREVLAGIPSPAADLSGRLGIGGLAGLLASADLVISNDSGPLHLAMAVGAPTIGIYWCGNLINAGPFSRSRHRPAISWQLDCPVCGVDCTRASCSHRESFVARVTLEEVLESALDLLRSAGPGSTPPSSIGATSPSKMDPAAAVGATP